MRLYYKHYDLCLYIEQGKLQYIFFYRHTSGYIHNLWPLLGIEILPGLTSPALWDYNTMRKLQVQRSYVTPKLSYSD